MAKIKAAIEEHRVDPRLLDERGPPARTLQQIWERAERVAAKTAAERKIRSDISEAISAATRTDGRGNLVGGNGHTVLKFREPAVSRLVSSGKIASEELRVIDEIERVYSHLCAVSMLRGYEIKERGDRAMPHEPTWFVDAYGRYKDWANKWSKKKMLGNPALEVTFDILFSNRSGKVIDTERGWKHGRATSLFITAIRDYAALAGWVDRNTAAKWTAT